MSDGRWPSRAALCLQPPAQAALGRRPGPVRAVTGRLNALSGRITGKLDFLIIVIVIAGPMVKSRSARKKMALGAALNHYARENMYIWINAPRSIRAIFQTSPKTGEVWRSLEKFGEFGEFGDKWLGPIRDQDDDESLTDLNVLDTQKQLSRTD